LAGDADIKFPPILLPTSALRNRTRDSTTYDFETGWVADCHKCGREGKFRAPSEGRPFQHSTGLGKYCGYFRVNPRKAAEGSVNRRRSRSDQQQQATESGAPPQPPSMDQQSQQSQVQQPQQVIVMGRPVDMVGQQHAVYSQGPPLVHGISVSPIPGLSEQQLQQLQMYQQQIHHIQQQQQQQQRMAAGSGRSIMMGLSLSGGGTGSRVPALGPGSSQLADMMGTVHVPPVALMAQSPAAVVHVGSGGPVVVEGGSHGPAPVGGLVQAETSAFSNTDSCPTSLKSPSIQSQSSLTTISGGANEGKRYEGGDWGNVVSTEGSLLTGGRDGFVGAAAAALGVSQLTAEGLLSTLQGHPVPGSALHTNMINQLQSLERALQQQQHQQSGMVGTPQLQNHVASHPV